MTLINLLSLDGLTVSTFNLYLFLQKFKNMNSIIILLSFLLAVSCNFDSRYPDALRCGEAPSYGAIYFAHSLSDSYALMYCQVFAGENRCVHFNGDGSYKKGQGDLGSRNGCTGKSLTQLKTEGRAFVLANQDAISNLQAEVKAIKNRSSNFWDYEQIKQIWKDQFKKQLLADIKANGLAIGSRWKISQQTSYLVIRDAEGTKSKDSRIALRANSYVDL